MTKRCPHCNEVLDATSADLAALPELVIEAARDAVCGTGIEWGVLFKRGRLPHIVRARWRVWGQLREAGYTFHRIADLFGVDHSTVQHGCRRMAQGEA